MPKEKAFEIIKANLMHAYFATCDGDQPVIRSISPIIDKDCAIWIATFANSRKVKQIKKNPRICLAFIQQPNGDKSATVFGKAEIVNDIEVKKKVWGIANYDLANYFPDGPSSKNFCLLMINIEKIEWRDSWENKPQVYQP